MTNFMTTSFNISDIHILLLMNGSRYFLFSESILKKEEEGGMTTDLNISKLLKKWKAPKI